MILALEGSDGVGKTSAVEELRRAFGLHVFSDRVRHGLLGEMSARDMFVAGNQCNLDLVSFSRQLHFAADRWVLSSFVYDGLRGIPPERFRDIFRRCAAASAWIFVLDLDPAEARERVVRRDGKPRRTLEEMIRIREGFSAAVDAWELAGGNVTVLDASAPDLRSRLLQGVELALMMAGREG